jgi:hypothetical protein
MIRSRPQFPAVALACALGLSALASTGTGAVEPVPLPGEGAGEGAMAPQLSIAKDGVRLSWVEPSTPGHAFKTATWRAGAWSPAVTIASGEDVVANGADVPSVAELPGGTLYAQWPRKLAGGGYLTELSRSTDGGQTWGGMGPLQSDRGAVEHGFVSLVAGGSGAQAVWLDGRRTAMEGATQLFTASLSATVEGERMLDERVCDCCRTAAAATDDGIVVVYRDRSDKDVRDIAALRFAGGQWSHPTPVHSDGWKILGCPVNGPAVAAVGRIVAVAWYTAAGNTPRVLLARSTDGGATFGPPATVDEVSPLGRVDVAEGPGGAAAVSWLARDGEGAELRLRRVDGAGNAGSPVVVARMAAGRSSGYPRMVTLGDRLVLAWIDLGGSSKGSRLRVASLAWQDIPEAKQESSAPK